jgi:hypothetical protein
MLTWHVIFAILAILSGQAPVMQQRGEASIGRRIQMPIWPRHVLLPPTSDNQEI